MEMYKLLDELYWLMMEEQDKHTALVLAEAYKKLESMKD